MRIVSAVKFRNRLGIAVAGFRLHQNTFLKMGLEETLECDEKRGAVVTVPVGVSVRHNFGIINLDFHLRIAGKGCVKRIEKQIAMKTVPRRHDPIKLELEVFVVICSAEHFAPPNRKTPKAYYGGRP